MIPHPTRFTELVGCRLPIQLAGMPRTSTPPLVSAVCNAGGLGMLGGARYTHRTLRDALAQIADATDAPFGVTFLGPFLDSALVTAAARVVELFWAPPDPEIVRRIHAEGALAGWQVGSTEEAHAAEQAGCDVIVVQGYEAGGHVRGTLPLGDLLAEISGRIGVPLLGAGGIGTHADAMRAIEAGADGVRCGTVFVAACESGAHPDYQQSLVDATAADTVVTTAFAVGWPDAPHRVLRACLDALADAPQVVGVITDDGVSVALARGSTPSPTRSTVGAIAAMPHHAGLSVDAVNAVRPAAEIVADLAGATV